ncbi:olfactory receptor 2D2-like [Spea bombifrons]|uniref:olfactory receptor 2D2-like n=1 Tax=Spea bombifrons TaxID=233779 RepID=UPI00234A4058|nr:olfactory receptor 2D2-like [Spea bombifrons]
MFWRNNSVVTEFILLGITTQPKTQVIIFGVVLIVYFIILFANSLIIFLTITNASLHKPMYFFLTNLSFLDICYSSSTVPRMLKDLMSAKKTISFTECTIQMYISFSLGEIECILLAIMAYDRYIAICYPLHYSTIINWSTCIKMAAGVWICGFLLSIFHVALTLNGVLCENNEINHFVCEIPEILSLQCENLFLIELTIFLVGAIILMTPVTLIGVSYAKIILTILKMTSSAGQRKAFSTCGSHMIVVIIYYGSCMASYMKPRSHSSPGTDKMIAIFYLIVTPMLNPLIYSLRNKDIKVAMKNLRVSKKP